MIAKRIIPCLDIKDGEVVKGINFENLTSIGDPVAHARYYSDKGADELVFLDITASFEKRKMLYELVSDVAKNINIPFTVGGGIDSLEDAESLLASGADKISINSSAIRNPELIDKMAFEFGNQFVVLAVDAKQKGNKWEVYIEGGRKRTGLDLFDWSREVCDRGCGEILFTSMNHDGVKQGYALKALKKLQSVVSVPVIASGGAGSPEHFIDLFLETEVNAALAASVFHYNTIDIPDLKNLLKRNGINIRSVV